MERIFKGRVVVPGEVTLKALVSHGGFNTLASFKDCKEGKNTCTDQNNPDLYGKSTVCRYHIPDRPISGQRADRWVCRAEPALFDGFVHAGRIAAGRG